MQYLRGVSMVTLIIVIIIIIIIIIVTILEGFQILYFLGSYWCWCSIHASLRLLQASVLCHKSS